MGAGWLLPESTSESLPDAQPASQGASAAAAIMMRAAVPDRREDLIIATLRQSKKGVGRRTEGAARSVRQLPPRQAPPWRRSKYPASRSVDETRRSAAAARSGDRPIRHNDVR